MSDLVFPSLPGLAIGIKKAPNWATIVQTTATLREVRVALSSSPVYDFELPYEFLRVPSKYHELEQLIGFFNQVLGSWDSWLYSDPTDNFAFNVLIGTGDGVTRTFTLSRSYGGSSEPVANIDGTTFTTDPLMWSPDPTVPMWNLDPSTLMWPGGSNLGDFTISGSQITFGTAPPLGVPVYWSGFYYYRCRFTNDSIQFQQQMPYYYSQDGVQFKGALGTKI